ncbi:hypothetical protein [Mesorhizobium amorphae]|uniref:hypothetical protein n=1 Tax=Mesorhizobium amorphae TaxID=71433 RepID=UPI001182E398|nr:hypothetical protein [Mesorhizobium amorphae]
MLWVVTAIIAGAVLAFPPKFYSIWLARRKPEIVVEPVPYAGPNSMLTTFAILKEHAKRGDVWAQRMHTSLVLATLMPFVVVLCILFFVRR